MLQPLLDILYPPKCGLCGKLGPRGLCDPCKSKFTPAATNFPAPPSLKSIHAPYLYETGADEAIKRLKFDRITPLAEPLSHILKSHADKHLADAYDVIIPVPIARARLSERGFNQAVLLAQAFPKNIVRPSYLKRTRYTKPQVGLNAKDRLTNLKDAFACPHPFNGARVLLIDDVITTGGTAISCAEELQKNGAGEIHLLTLAIQPITN
jgi:competence protein ComFC